LFENAMLGRVAEEARYPAAPQPADDVRISLDRHEPDAERLERLPHRAADPAEAAEHHVRRRPPVHPARGAPLLDPAGARAPTPRARATQPGARRTSAALIRIVTSAVARVALYTSAPTWPADRATCTRMNENSPI